MTTAFNPPASWVAVPCHGFPQVPLFKAQVPRAIFILPPSTVLSELVLNYCFSAWHHLQIYPGLSKEPLFKSAISAQGMLGKIGPCSPAVNCFGHLLLQHHIQLWSSFIVIWDLCNCSCGKATFLRERWCTLWKQLGELQEKSSLAFGPTGPDPRSLIQMEWISC